MGMLIEDIKKEYSIEDQVEFLIAVRNLKCTRGQEWSKGTDFVALDAVTDKKVLIRMMERDKSGYIRADDIKDMAEAMRRMNCGSGFFIGKRFTNSATEEMSLDNIQRVSDDYMPPTTSENMILIINNSIDDLCRKKCGAVPLKESDCKDRFKEAPCKVRSISDDAFFHYGLGWMDLLKNDLRKLLSIKKIVKT
jgi:hypothetical protein